MPNGPNGRTKVLRYIRLSCLIPTLRLRRRRVGLALTGHRAQLLAGRGKRYVSSVHLAGSVFRHASFDDELLAHLQHLSVTAARLKLVLLSPLQSPVRPAALLV